jgi:hypothetical protein
LIPPDQQLERFMIALQASFDTALVVVRHGFFLPGKTTGNSKSFEILLDATWQQHKKAERAGLSCFEDDQQIHVHPT